MAMSIRDIEELDNGPLASKEGVIRVFATSGIAVVRESRCHLYEEGWTPEPLSPKALGEAPRKPTYADRMGWIPFTEMAERSGKPLYYVAMLVSMGKVSGSMKSKKGSFSGLEVHLGSRKKQ